MPYGIIGVALLTALLPRMSRAAARTTSPGVVQDLSLGTRLSALGLLPVTAAARRPRPAAGAWSPSRAATPAPPRPRAIGTALAIGAFGLLPMAVTLLQLRVFYAMKDARTPTLIQLGMVAVRVPLLLLVPVVVGPERRRRRADARHQHHLRRRLGARRPRAAPAAGLACARGRRSGRSPRMAAVVGRRGRLGWLVRERDRRPARHVRGRLARDGRWSVPWSSAARLSQVSWSPAFRRSGSPWQRSGPGGDADDRSVAGRRAAAGAARPGGRRQDRGSTVSMTSTTTGLPDRYRPLDQVGPDEPTPTGVIRCWRAKDRVLNRDVAIRVHTPGRTGRARLDQPRADRRRPGHPGAGDGLRRLRGHRRPADAPAAPPTSSTSGSTARRSPSGWPAGRCPSARSAPCSAGWPRASPRRTASGLAVGGLTPDNVVLRPNGLVGLRAVPAATGTIDGDIAALGALLEACLTGLDPRRRRAAAAHRPAPTSWRWSAAPGPPSPARACPASPPWRRCSPSARAPAPATGPAAARAPEETATAAGCAGCATAGPTRRPSRPRPPSRPGGRGDPVRARPADAAPGPAGRARSPRARHRSRPAALGGDTIDAGTVAPSARRLRRTRCRAGRHALRDRTTTTSRSACSTTGDAEYDDGTTTGATDDDEDGARRHRLVVVGLPLLALAVVVALAWWFGNDAALGRRLRRRRRQGSTPVGGSAAGGSALAERGAARGRRPGHDRRRRRLRPAGRRRPGEPRRRARSPSTATRPPPGRRSTYRGSPAFGNLKDGVGVAATTSGGEQELAGVTVTTHRARRHRRDPHRRQAGRRTLDGFAAAADGTLEGDDRVRLRRARRPPATCWSGSPAWCRASGGFSADLAEVDASSRRADRPPVASRGRRGECRPYDPRLCRP